MHLGEGINQSRRWTLEWNAGSSDRRIRYWHIFAVVSAVYILEYEYCITHFVNSLAEEYS